DEQRDAHLLLVRPPVVLARAVLEEGLAVVAREHEEAVAEDPALLEPREPGAEERVEPVRTAAIEREVLRQAGHQARIELLAQRSTGRLAHAMHEGLELGLALVRSLPVGAVRAVGVHEQEHGPAVVAREEVVRPRERVPELALPAVLLLEPGEALVEAEVA